MCTIIFIVLLGVCIFTPQGQFAVSNCHNFVYYAPRDIYDYFKYKRWHECKSYGYIKVFNGYFGSGKSLSAVDTVVSIYNQYNNQQIYDDELGEWITQRITIYSNITLKGIPYHQFISEQQFIDVETKPGEILIFLIDEIGTVWNNRDFKNFNPDVFNNIVQSRKRKMAIYGTLPVLAGTDINIRRYTDSVTFCSKWWRVVKHRVFRASELENCSNPDMLQPEYVYFRFIRDKMYKQYDTNYLVDKLKKSMADGHMLTYNELNVTNNEGDIRFAKLRKRYKGRQK